MISFPSGTEMFHFPEYRFHNLCIQLWMTGHYSSRVSPFGDLRVITPVCGSPKLIAAYHVLLRLSVPRHPSCALISLTTKKLDKVVLIRRRTTEKLYVDITQFFNYQRTPDAQASCIINGLNRLESYITFRSKASRSFSKNENGGRTWI